MQPPQAFGVAVRVVGLLGWLVAFFYVVSMLLAILAPDYGIRPWWRHALAAAVLFVVGWVLLRGADWLVAFAYRTGNADAADS
jgi:hypothetical protein